MKTLASLLLFSFLSACTTVLERTENWVYSQYIPKSWMLEGRLSASVDGNTETADFVLNRQGEYHQLILTGSLGFGQMQVKQTAQGLLVDGKLTEQTLQEWMRAELSWTFPIEKLEQLVFKHNLENIENWQVFVSKYQVINEVTYPKIVHFKNTTKAIKIKLLLREVNRLK
uniref:lipoprotein insertase outer membrane protein LolB n=1 Tax=Candidatus Thiodubiliella endoseptemdiera TaxID=2738886 RepID=UPI0034DE637C